MNDDEQNNSNEKPNPVTGSARRRKPFTRMIDVSDQFMYETFEVGADLSGDELKIEPSNTTARPEEPAEATQSSAGLSTLLSSGTHDHLPQDDEGQQTTALSSLLQSTGEFVRPTKPEKQPLEGAAGTASEKPATSGFGALLGTPQPANHAPTERPEQPQAFSPPPAFGLPPAHPPEQPTPIYSKQPGQSPLPVLPKYVPTQKGSPSQSQAPSKMGAAPQVPSAPQAKPAQPAPLQQKPPQTFTRQDPPAAPAQSGTPAPRPAQLAQPGAQAPRPAQPAQPGSQVPRSAQPAQPGAQAPRLAQPAQSGAQAARPAPSPDPQHPSAPAPAQATPPATPKPAVPPAPAPARPSPGSPRVASSLTPGLGFEVPENPFGRLTGTSEPSQSNQGMPAQEMQPFQSNQGLPAQAPSPETQPSRSEFEEQEPLPSPFAPPAHTEFQKQEPLPSPFSRPAQNGSSEGSFSPSPFASAQVEQPYESKPYEPQPFIPDSFRSDPEPPQPQSPLHHEPAPEPPARPQSGRPPEPPSRPSGLMGSLQSKSGPGFGRSQSPFTSPSAQHNTSQPAQPAPTSRLQEEPTDLDDLIFNSEEPTEPPTSNQTSLSARHKTVRRADFTRPRIPQLDPKDSDVVAASQTPELANSTGHLAPSKGARPGRPKPKRGFMQRLGDFFGQMSTALRKLFKDED